SYTQESASSLSTLEASAQPSSFLNLIPPPVPSYSPEGGHFYSGAPNLFPGLDVRPRLASNSSTSGPGMAQAPRSTTLPHPASQLSTRDIYSPATPSYRRQPDHHLPRSPSFPAIRRHPLSSPTPSPITYSHNPLRMDPGYGNKSQPNIPPLNPMVSLGHLTYQDPQQTPIKAEINGIIDKGFFLADNEWTCYRRNYFSCVCSYSLSPPNPNYPNAGIQFLRTGESQPYQVYGFAMCISAVVADNESLAIELVQHTPKRDKGPIAKPEKVRLSSKPPQASHHPINSIYNTSSGVGDLASSRGYDQGFGQTQSNLNNEHTFERIQFKQATANNGKRRAAQQYYHLIVELWADTGSQQGDPFVKVAFKKSAKMIVRGRSPGHYQSERRASTSSGPGGSGGGSIAGTGYSSGMVGGGDYSSSQSMMQTSYGQSYDPRGYGGTRHHDLSMEPMISAEECKAITEPKAYQYYAGPIYESEDSRQHHIELFSHARSETESGSSSGSTTTLGSGGFDPTKVNVKGESETGVPSVFYAGSFYPNARCGRFEGKPTSAGYYPTAIPSSSSMNMT
ncbi:hypothetical protein B0T16DRAFT_330496, partial [Cercophora newfieldiana]